MNSSFNMCSNDAFRNANLLVNQFRDETARHFQKQQVYMSSLTPGAAPIHLQAVHAGDIFKLRTELSTYNEELQAKPITVDAAQQNGLAALQVIAADAATEWVCFVASMMICVASPTMPTPRLQRFSSRWTQRWEN